MAGRDDFLTRPHAWTRAARDGASQVDRACALHRVHNGGTRRGLCMMLVAAAAALGLLGLALAVRYAT